MWNVNWTDFMGVSIFYILCYYAAGLFQTPGSLEIRWLFRGHFLSNNLCMFVKYDLHALKVFIISRLPGCWVAGIIKQLAVKKSSDCFVLMSFKLISFVCYVCYVMQFCWISVHVFHIPGYQAAKLLKKPGSLQIQWLFPLKWASYACRI